MKKYFINLAFILSVFIAAFFTGCNFDSKNNGPATVAISITTESAGMRSAVPYYSDSEIFDSYWSWSITATPEGGGTKVFGTQNASDNKVFTFENVTSGTWNFVLEVRAYGRLVFQGEKKIKVTAGKNYSESIIAKYITDSTVGNGEIRLLIVNEDIDNFKITAYSDSDLKTPASFLNVKQNQLNPKQIILNNSSIVPGDYDVYFKVSSGEVTLCVIKQKICVRSNAQTNAWVSSGEVYFKPLSDGSANFILSKEIINKYNDTQVYVTGTGGTLTAPAEGETGNGTWKKPYTSLKAAFDKISILNDKTTKYTIWIDGEVVNEYAPSSDPIYLFTILAKEEVINLSILGLNGSREKDIINLNNKCGLFFSEISDISISLKNLKVINGTANYGGVIYICDDDITVDIDNCYFKNNSAVLNGGALDFAATTGEINIKNSTFEENSAKFGGAISSQATATIQNCTFTKNHASFGGAIHSENNDGDYVNHITLSGKVIAQDNYITGDANKLSNVWLNSEEKLIIANDFSKDSKVGITSKTDLVEANNYQFTFTSGYSNCSATESGIKPGNIFTSDENFLVTWDENSEAKLFDGGAYIDVETSVNEMTFNLSKCSISKYSEITEDSITITPQIDRTDLSNNCDSITAILFYKGTEKKTSNDTKCKSITMTLSSDELESLSEGTYQLYVKANYESKEYSTTQNIEVRRCVLQSDLSNISGSTTPIRLSADVNATSLGSDYLKLDYGFTKGGSAKLILNDGKEHIIDGAGKQVIATNKRLFAVSGATTTVIFENLVFKGNQGYDEADTEGSVILVEGGAKVILRNCTITNFKRYTNGLIQVVNGSLEVENCSFSNNFANPTSLGNWGGTVRIDTEGKCIIRNSVISNNRGYHMGAGLYNDGWLEIYDSFISSNTAQRAAALYSNGKHLYLSRTTFKSNKANDSMYNANAAGAIWLNSPDSEAIYLFEECNFINNVSEYYTGQNATNAGREHTGGGAIYIENTHLRLKNCTFSNNESEKNGGCIQLYAGTNSTSVPSVTFEGTTVASGNKITSPSKYKGHFLFISSEKGALVDNQEYAKGYYSDTYPLQMDNQ